MRVVRLELVDDQVPHPDRPAAEGDEEQREERQHPVVEEAADELRRPLGLHREAVRAGDREPAQRAREEPCEHEPEPHLRGRGQHVRERQHAVVERLAAGGERADLVPGPEAEQDRRYEQRERVRQRAEDQRRDRGGEVHDAAAEIAAEERRPEVEVLLPQRDVEAERLRVVAGQDRLRARLGLHPREELLDRVARHEARDRPVDRHRDPEGDEVDADLPCQVSGHRVSSAE